MNGASSTLSLEYAFLPTPNQILVSVAGANPSTISLQVIVSPPATTPVTVTHIQIGIPTGQEIAGDLSTAPNLPPPTYDTTGPWTISANGPTVTIAPTTGSAGSVTAPIVFTLPSIQVNEIVGTVPITITEYYPPPTPKATDDSTYALVKQPADFPISSFTVSPTVLYDIEQSVTLNWSCSSQGRADAFGLRIASVQGPPPDRDPAKAVAPPTRLNNCLGGGQCYSCADGTDGVAYGPVDQTTTFALDAIQAAPNGRRTVVATVEATVRVLTPSISSLSYLTPLYCGYVASLHWLAFNAGRCVVTVNGEVYDDQAPVDTYDQGYLIGLTATSAPNQISVTAYAQVGEARSTFALGAVAITPPGSVQVGVGPMHLAATPDSTLALVTNTNSRTATLIDLATAQPAAPAIATGTMPAALAFTADGAGALVGNYVDNSVTVVDVAGRRAEPNAIPVGAGPTAIAVTPDGTLALVAGFADNTVTVIDVAGSQPESPPIPTGSGPSALAITPDNAHALAVNQHDGTVTVIDIAGRQAEPNAIPVGETPQWIAITPDGATALVTNSGSDTVSLIDVASRSVVATLATGATPGMVAITPDGTLGFIVNTDSANVTVIDVVQGQAAAGPIPVGAGPTAIAVTPDGTLALVACGGAGTVAVIDVANRRALPTTIPTGAGLKAIAVSPNGTYVVVTNYGGNSATVISTPLEGTRR